MTPESEQVTLALRKIAEAREHLRLAGDVLSALNTADVTQESPAAVVGEGRQLELGAPQDILDIAHEVIHQVFPEQLAQRARQDGTTPRDWLYRQRHHRAGGDDCDHAGSS
ncbi:MAG: hypothetical protein J4G18_16850 [Anaerolineae bacterium]|nr:hypothetical protein [Anaerolineae bacterium]